MYLMLVLIFLSAFIVQNVLSEQTHDHRLFNNDTVEEIEHAICKIVTEDIQASANASITRQLSGVCTSRELRALFDNLEDRILNELDLIKQALGIKSQIKLKSFGNQNSYYNDIVDNEIKSQIVSSTKTTNFTKSQTTSSKSNLKNTNNNQTSVSYKRDLEAAKNNGTIQTTELGKSFLYYWRVYDIQEAVKNHYSSVESSIFSVQGVPYQIKFHLEYLGTNYAAIQLENYNNYLVNHRFVILNQINEQEDASSQILGRKATVFRISKDKLFHNNFIADDSLIIKLIIVSK